MKSLVIALAVVLIAATLPDDAAARRFGGGGAAGMQRSLPPRAAPQAIPAKPAAPTAQPVAPATAAAPAIAPKRSWLGPIAGLAAGLGIAALMSHFGLGAAFGNILMMLLLAVAAFAVIRFLMRRFGPAGPMQRMQPAGAGAPFQQAPQPSFIGSASVSTPVAASLGPQIPAGFDVPAFERIAKMIFIRMQAANDAADLNDLRSFTTPEMFASARLEIQERAGMAQQTDVVRVDAEVIDVATEAERQIVSVRFHGLIRERADAAAEAFDEIWHVVRPVDGSREWAIAGIQPA